MIIKRKNLYTNIFIIGYVIFCTFIVGIKTPEVWADYNVYQHYFDDSANSISYIITNTHDPLFALLMHFFSKIPNGFDIFLICCAATTLLLKFYSVSKVTEKFFLFIVLYSSYLLCLHDYIQIRVALALAFFCFSLYVCSGWTRVFLFLISIFIHLSLIVPLIVFYLLKSKSIGYQKVCWSAPIIISLSLLIQRGVISIARVNQYLELQMQGVGVDINVYSVLPFFQLITVLFIFFNKKYLSYKNTFEYVMAYVGVTIFYSTLSMPVVALRCFEISNLFFIILLSRLFFTSYYSIIFFMYIVVGIKNYGQLLDINIPFLT